MKNWLKTCFARARVYNEINLLSDPEKYEGIALLFLHLDNAVIYV